MNNTNKLTLISLEDSHVLESLGRLPLTELITLSGLIRVAIDRKCQMTQPVQQVNSEPKAPATSQSGAAKEGVARPLREQKSQSDSVANIDTKKYINVGGKVFRKKEPKARSLQYTQSQNWLEKAKDAISACKAPKDGEVFYGLKLQLGLAQEYSFLVRQFEKAGKTAIAVDKFRGLVKAFGITSFEDLQRAREAITNLVPLTIVVDTANAVEDLPDNNREDFISVHTDFVQHWLKTYAHAAPNRNTRIYVPVSGTDRVLLKKQLLIKEESDVEGQKPKTSEDSTIEEILKSIRSVDKTTSGQNKATSHYYNGEVEKSTKVNTDPSQIPSVIQTQSESKKNTAHKPQESVDQPKIGKVGNNPTKSVSKEIDRRKSSGASNGSRK